MRMLDAVIRLRFSHFHLNWMVICGNDRRSFSFSHVNALTAKAHDRNCEENIAYMDNLG